MKKVFSAVLATAMLAVLLPHAANAESDQEKLVAASEKTFNQFIADPNMSWIRQNIGRAKAVLITPAVLRVGFILGGSGGRAVLLAPDPKTGKWNGPAFYHLATGSVGFQAGVDVSEAVMLVMTDKGFNSLLGNTFRLGGDIGIAAGPVGAGAKGDIPADFIAYSRARGIYGGINFDGSSVSSNEDWNRRYYGKPATATDILIRGGYSNPNAAHLVGAVAAAAGKK